MPYHLFNDVRTSAAMPFDEIAIREVNEEKAAAVGRRKASPVLGYPPCLQLARAKSRDPKWLVENISLAGVRGAARTVGWRPRLGLSSRNQVKDTGYFHVPVRSGLDIRPCAKTISRPAGGFQASDVYSGRCWMTAWSSCEHVNTHNGSAGRAGHGFPTCTCAGWHILCVAAPCCQWIQRWIPTWHLLPGPPPAPWSTQFPS